MQTDTRVAAGPAIPPPTPLDSRAGKYLIFRLGTEEFGVPVLQAREILALQEVTPVPNTPDHILGVINLRGKIIPVADLRRKFNLDPQSAGSHPCIVIVQVQRESESILIGVVVDGVVEVTNIPSSDIDDAPDFGEAVFTPWLLGLARTSKGVRILLRVDRVLAAHELEGVAHLTSVTQNS